ncbi:hypothetical protein NI17_008785 [Thermobifida halotolerans]|uniref:Uncharacterized protein n=1 Tax=Thermobifida halotolerans TaxID=483545 RepID=A0AA97M090_9ACTN|nr:hypothetical protein [Thermobifida halotolerans]UOE21216.1 hypothetical protein NI17_008785 [Thermobifida halotolerans]
MERTTTVEAGGDPPEAGDRPERTGGGGWAKTVSHFLPASTVTAEEADRYYTRVHTRFARHFLREMDQVVSYHTNRAVAQYDLLGGWERPPRAFRYVVLRFRPGRGLELADGLRETIVADHRLFLRELRPFRVREEVLLDRLGGQTALEKYLFEFDRRDGTDPEEARHHLAEGMAVLAQEASSAFGVRQILVDHVLQEQATEPVDEPGQRPLPRMLSTTPRQAFVECYFDQREWAEEFFARPAVRAVLQNRFWAAAHGYRVAERCGLDRR